MYEPRSGDKTKEEKAVKYIKVIKYLVTRGTNVRHALYQAHFEGVKEAIWIICRHVGKPNLITTIKLGWQEDITRLLESGEDPNQSYLNNTTPLHCAAREGNKDVCALLLEHSTDINAQCCYRRTPLTQAITSKNFKLVKYLVTHGANIHQEDLYRTGLLIYSARYGI
ncbi:ankyrin repeat-containing domain protein [Aspergillus varians]